MTELSPEDKEQLNRDHNNGKLNFCNRRKCDLCNTPGITHRKISGGNVSLLCKSCAVDYCLKAIRLIERSHNTEEESVHFPLCRHNLEGGRGTPLATMRNKSLYLGISSFYVT